MLTQTTSSFSGTDCCIMFQFDYTAYQKQNFQVFNYSVFLETSANKCKFLL